MDEASVRASVAFAKLFNMLQDMSRSLVLERSVAQDVSPVVSLDRILRALFGPTRWASRASVALGVSARFVAYVARGERYVPQRMVARLLAVAEHRHVSLETERKLAHERIDRLYDAGQKALLQAKIDLAILAKERAKTKRKGASRRRPSPQAPTET